MKTLLILVLLLALLAAAFFTRPSRASFSDYYATRKPVPANANLIETVIKESQRDAEVGALEFKDRFLWVEMVKDEKTQYVGAFSHWFDKADPMTLPKPAAPAN